MKAGRPTDYNEDTVKKVSDYVKQCRKEKTPPTKAGLAVYIDVVKQTLYNWAKKYPDFLDALKKLEDFQEDDVIRYSLKGEYNSTIAKLILQNNHGYTDKQDVTTGGDKIRGLNIYKPKVDEELEAVS